jgi:hypothetical protein
MRKSIISTLALASLASVTLLFAADPAAAKPRSCNQKFQDCIGRCMFKDGVACAQRTCVPQERNCREDVGGSAGTSGAKGGTKGGAKGGAKGGKTG